MVPNAPSDQNSSGHDHRPPVSLVVLTFNEELNLDACLSSAAKLARSMFVVDSGSTDRTLDIARSYGATVVQHTFTTHAEQWAWALTSLPIGTSWVLALDADQQITPELAADIAATLGRDEDIEGYFLCRRQVFRGRWIRHGGYYPKYLLKLFKRRAVSLDSRDLVDHHFLVGGRTGNLAGDLIEDNRNEQEIAVWTAKHNRYAVLQARQELAAGGDSLADRGSWFGSPDERTKRLKSTWRRMPLFVRPCAYVFYRYVLRLGFLDGKEGFIFHVLQAFWYRLLVDVNIDELQQAQAYGPVADGVDAAQSGAAASRLGGNGV